METYESLLKRIDALVARSARSRGDEELLVEIEHVLSDGYTVALSGEARMIRLEEELDSLLSSGDRSRARDLRMLLTEHRSTERSVATLRSMLARLHHEFVALGGARRSDPGRVG